MSLQPSLNFQPPENPARQSRNQNSFPETASPPLHQGDPDIGHQAELRKNFTLRTIRNPKGPPSQKACSTGCSMMPKGAGRLRLSKLNMGGIGTMLMKRVMKSKNVMDLPALVQSAQEGASGLWHARCRWT